MNKKLPVKKGIIKIKKVSNHDFFNNRISEHGERIDALEYKHRLFLERMEDITDRSLSIDQWINVGYILCIVIIYITLIIITLKKTHRYGTH